VTGVALVPARGDENSGFRFNLADAHVRPNRHRRVAVLVVDIDGCSASAEPGSFASTSRRGSDGDFPPICTMKPWLPQCQEPMARPRQIPAQGTA